MNIYENSTPVLRPNGTSYVVLLSGGLDSSVLAYHLASLKMKLKALTVDYGQRHVIEQASAKKIAARLGIEHRVVSLQEVTPLFGEECSLLNGDREIPNGHYEHDSMKSTVVPNRNMILLSLATAWSVASGFDGVAYAAHAGDHTIYPDCRPIFAEAMATAISLCDFSPQELTRPFIQLSKADVVRLGESLQVPFSETWSCYNGRERHCGTCGTCTERIEAFQLASVSDPTTYE